MAYIAARQEPAIQFVWNDYLLEPLRGHVHDDWIVYLIHGFLSQLGESTCTLCDRYLDN